MSLAVSFLPMYSTLCSAAYSTACSTARIIIFLVLFAPVLTALLLGCEGSVTESILLEPDANGGFAAVKIKLTPDKLTQSLNFRAEQVIDASAVGKWNSYEATLTHTGAAFKRVSQFNFNYDGTADSQPGAAYQMQTIMIVRMLEDEGGEYELVIKPTKTAEVKLQNVRIEIRANVINTNERLSRKKWDEKKLPQPR